NLFWGRVPGSNPGGPATLYPGPSFAAYALFLQTKGLSPITIRKRIRQLKYLSKLVDLSDPEAVSRTINSNQSWSSSYKQHFAYAYADYCELNGLTYKLQKFHRVKKLPYIPTESRIDRLIGSFSPKMAALCQLLKETAFRVCEACRLTVGDVDLERRIITLNRPAKGSDPRQVKISNHLAVMISRITIGKTLNQRIWPSKPDNIRRKFSIQRRRAVEKLSDPELAKIHLHTFRHFKATMEYHKTKDILYIKKLLGHRNIQNTLIYTHLIDFPEDEWTARVATTVDEASKLVEAGFDYVTQFEGKMIFRKRK
ncbi:MAG: tyrosine-type recombinase/integrase, partial [Candidatus Bathyarchaeia archaeon]